MKKSLIALAFASLAMLFIGCQGPADNSAPKTLTEKLNVSGDVDFQNATIAEDADINKAKTVSNLDVDGKTLTVNVKNVILKNVKNANVIAASGIGEGDLTIEGSNLKSLTVQGGGANSIHVKGTEVKTVSVEKAGVRLALEEGTTLNKVEIKADNVKYEAAKDVKATVEIAENVTSVNIASGTIEEIKVKGNTAPKILVTGAAEINNVPATVAVSVTEEAKEKVSVTSTTGAKVEVETVKLLSTVLDCSSVVRSYKVGDKFDFTGIYLVKTYSNGTVEKIAVTDANAVTGFSSEKEGKVKVTVKVDELIKEFDVNVYDDCAKINLTENFAYFFDTDKINSKLYNVEYIDCDGVLPEEGGKVKLNIKATSNINIDSLFANVVYWDVNGKRVIASSSKDVEVKKNIKANEEFTATVTFENVTVKRGYISLMLFAEKGADVNTKLLLSNGDIPATKKYIKAEQAETGIKLTVYPKDGKFNQYGGGSIDVLNAPIVVNVLDESFLENPTAPVSYVYPFVEKDKTYVFKYNGDVVALKSDKTCSTLETYVTAEQQKRWESIKPTVKYDPNTKDFHYGFESDITKLGDICNAEKVSSKGTCFGNQVILGGTYYSDDGGSYQGSNSTWVNDKGVLVTYNDNDYNNKDFFAAAAKCEVLAKWRGPELTYERWKEYNFKYVSLFEFCFRTIEDPTTQFRFCGIYSPIAVYEVKESAKNLDVDTAMKNAVKDVKKYPASQDEVISLLTETYSDFEAIFAGSQRTAVPEGATKNPLEAADQLSGFVKAAMEVYKNMVQSNGYIWDIDFDKTVNLGELTFSDWIKVLCDSYDAFNVAMYGAKEGWGANTQKLGVVPEGYNAISWSDQDMKYHFVKMEWSSYSSTVLEIGPVCGDGHNIYSTWSENGVYYYGYYNSFKITSSAEIVSELDSLCKSLNMTRDELLALLDKYVSIKNFYLHTDVYVDADLEKIKAGKTLDNLVSAKVAEDINLAVVDVDGAIAEVMKVMKAPEGTKIVSPVKAASLGVSSEIGAKSTNKLFNVISDSEKMATPDALIEVVTEANVSFAVVAKAAICTSAGNGGILTVELGLDADKEKALKAYEVYQGVVTSGDFTKLYALDNLKTVKISVSDGSKDTWSHAYTIEEIYNLVNDMFGSKEQ